jgi:ActR/RegA family two-component response regulator
MIKEPILIIDDSPHAYTAAPALVALGYRVVSACNPAEGLRELETIRPPRVIVGAEMPGASELVDSIRIRDKQIQILMTTAGKLEAAMAGFSGRADEFVRLPATSLILQVTLRRMDTAVRLRRRVRSLTDNLEARARDQVGSIIETERFLAVRQIVEKMSAFIRQVASDAQGGMRYFNELPYFVSIHDNDGNIDLVIEIFAGTKEIERLAEESRRTHQRYEQLFNSVPSSIVVLDRRFRMNAETTDSVFDLFYSTKGHRGTGIGLYVTRKIVQKHGRRIAVSSQLGKGSRFEIVLPLEPITTKKGVADPASQK